MKSPSMTEAAFNKAHAAGYDDQWKALASIANALYLLMRGAFETLPEKARILCAGAGTGAEILYLAQTFPGWRFVGFDPSEAMLDVCRERLEAAGIADRCELHVGYVHELPESEPFDAATSILVSHFITDAKERAAYFQALSERIKPGGLFINADLAPDKTNPGFACLLDIWLGTIAVTGMTAEKREQYKTMFGETVAAHTPDEVETMLSENGFPAPVHFYQAMITLLL